MSNKLETLERKWQRYAFKCKFCQLKYTINAMLTHIKVTHAQHYYPIKTYIDSVNEITGLKERDFRVWDQFGPLEIGRR
jgi:hypothetical protein